MKGRIIEIPFGTRALTVPVAYRVPEGDAVCRFLSFTATITSIVGSVAVAELGLFNKSGLSRITVRDTTVASPLTTQQASWFPEAGSIITGAAQNVRCFPFLELLVGGDLLQCQYVGGVVTETLLSALLTYLVEEDD